MSIIDNLWRGIEVKWETIDNLFHIKNGYTPSKSNEEYWKNGKTPWFRMEDIRKNGRVLSDSIQHVSESAVKGQLISENSLLMSTTATIGEHALILVPYLTNQQITNFSLKTSFTDIVSIKYLFYCFFEFGKWCVENANKNGGLSIIGTNKLKDYQIPIPPLEVQKEIVRILDKFTELNAELNAELTARKKQYNYYREQLLRFEDGKVEWKTLGEVVNLQRGRRLVKSQLEEIGKYAVYQNSMTPLGYYDSKNVNGYTTFIICAGAAGEIGFSNNDYWAADDVHSIITPDNINNKFLYYFLQTQQHKILSQVRRASVPRLSKTVLEKINIPIPPLKEQERIVSILDQFDILTNSISEGLPKEIELRKKQYEYYRDLLLSFPH